MRHSCTKSLSPFLACTVVLHAVFSRTFDSIKHCWAFVLTSKGPHTMLSCIICVCVCVWSGWKDSLCHVELANTESRGEKLHNSSAVWSQPPRGITTTFPQNTPLVWACLQPCSQYCTHRHKRCKKKKKKKDRLMGHNGSGQVMLVFFLHMHSFISVMLSWTTATRQIQPLLVGNTSPGPIK